MAVTAPWHSIKDDVHHNNDECFFGGEIKFRSVRLGTGNKPLCKDCVRLNDSGRRPKLTVVDEGGHSRSGDPSGPGR